MGPDDEDAAIGRDRRDRGAAAVEHDQVGAKLLGAAGAGEDVREADRAREPTAAAAAPDGGKACQRRGLEVIRRGVPPRARQLEQVGGTRLHLHELRLRRPAAAHRDDDDAAATRDDAADVSRHRRLADALPRSDYRE